MVQGGATVVMDCLKEAAAGGEGKGGGRRNLRKRRKWIYGGAMVRKGDGVFYPNNNFKPFPFPLHKPNAP